jgi:sugar lactone lactonase YvrE
VQTLPALDVLIAARASVCKSPVIDRRAGWLCWVDIPEGALYEDDAKCDSAGRLWAGSTHVE